MLEVLIFVIFPFCMIFAAVSDMISMTIANRISVILVAAFAVAAPLTGMDWATYGWHFAAGALVLSITFGMFAAGFMGGGDAKLLSSTAVWMGLSMQLMQYVFYAAMIGGVLTLLIIIYRRTPLSTMTGNNLFLRNFANDKVGVPYGVALGAAGLLVYPSTPIAAWALARFAAG
ncbi:MAG: A24 family peptidase [Rhizobiaceae bacterium]